VWHSRVDRGWVVLDGATVTRYSPIDEPHLLSEFIAIESSRDVSRYASRFGLLRRVGERGLREPLSEWWDEIGLVRGALCVQLDLLAAVRGSERDMAHLRQAWEATVSPPRRSLSDSEIVADARETVIAAVNRGLAGSELHVFLNRASRVIFSPHARDLLGFIYFALAEVVVDEPPLARCVECGVPFIVHDRRQRYCSARHASRARYRRFRSRDQGDRALVS
jgi:hypothetical protein